MNFIKSIFLYFKSKIKRKKELKLIVEPDKLNINSDKDSFKNLLKYKEEKIKKNKKIETLICHGDGLGIKNKVSY